MSGLSYTVDFSESCSIMCLLNGASDITLFLHFMQTKEDSEAVAEKEAVARGTDQQDSLEDRKDDVVGEFTIFFDIWMPLKSPLTSQIVLSVH